LQGCTQHLSALSARPRAFASHPSMTASTAAPLVPEAPWVVLKFGGTSVATADRWRTIQQLAAARRAEGVRVIIVVSALAGVTDALKALCACAPAEREAVVAKLVDRHRALAAEMGLMETAEMDRRLASLQALIFPLPSGEGGAAAPGEGSNVRAGSVGSGPSPRRVAPGASRRLSRGERGYLW